MDSPAPALELIERVNPARKLLVLVLTKSLTLREFLGVLRVAMGFSKAHFLPVPMPLVRGAARAGGRLPSMLLDRDLIIETYYAPYYE